MISPLDMIAILVQLWIQLSQALVNATLCDIYRTIAEITNITKLVKVILLLLLTLVFFYARRKSRSRKNIQKQE